MRFLDAMRPDWNISLFHYRNHGADYGRVLVGMQVPLGDHEAFASFLNNLGYRYWDETENPAYRLFLGSRTRRSVSPRSEPVRPDPDYPYSPVGSSDALRTTGPSSSPRASASRSMVLSSRLA